MQSTQRMRLVSLSKQTEIPTCMHSHDLPECSRNHLKGHLVISTPLFFSFSQNKILNDYEKWKIKIETAFLKHRHSIILVNFKIIHGKNWSQRYPADYFLFYSVNLMFLYFHLIYFCKFMWAVTYSIIYIPYAICLLSSFIYISTIHIINHYNVNVNSAHMHDMNLQIEKKKKNWKKIIYNNYIRYTPRHVT